MIVGVVQEKGGVGKTTTVINLGGWLGKLGYRTLLIDLDPQGNLAKGLGVNPPGGGMYRVFRDPAAALSGAIVPTTIPNVDLAPADPGLEAAEIELIHALSRESVLRRKIDAEGLRDRYERIIIDCRPSLGVLTVNAMVASDRLLIPVETQYFAIEALQTLLDVVKMVRETLNPGLEIAGIVPTKHEPRVRVCQAALGLLQERYPDLLTGTVIRKYVAFPEAQLRGEPIYAIAPGSDASEAYHALALELEGSRLGSGTTEDKYQQSSRSPRRTGGSEPDAASQVSLGRRNGRHATHDDHVAAQAALPLDGSNN